LPRGGRGAAGRTEETYKALVVHRFQRGLGNLIELEQVTELPLDFSLVGGGGRTVSGERRGSKGGGHRWQGSKEKDGERPWRETPMRETRTTNAAYLLLERINVVGRVCANKWGREGVVVKRCIVMERERERETENKKTGVKKSQMCDSGNDDGYGNL
jgi:hypothetical protein